MVLVGNLSTAKMLNGLGKQWTQCGQPCAENAVARWLMKCQPLVDGIYGIYSIYGIYGVYIYIYICIMYMYKEPLVYGIYIWYISGVYMVYWIWFLDHVPLALSIYIHTYTYIYIYTIYNV